MEEPKDAAGWLEDLPTQTLTDDLKQDIIEQFESEAENMVANREAEIWAKTAVDMEKLLKKVKEIELSIAVIAKR